MTAVDFYHDQDKELWKTIEEDGLPEFVRFARAATEEELQGLAPGEFADPENRMFPVHSRADTWKSIAYFNRIVDEAVPKKAVAYPETVKVRTKLRGMLSKAAGLWGLSDKEVEKLNRHVTLVKVAQPDKPVVHVAGTEVELEDAGTVQRTAKKIASMETNPFEGIQEAAGAVLKAAAAEEIELSPEHTAALRRCSGDAACTAGEAYRYCSDLAARLPHYASALPDLRAVRGRLAQKNRDELIPPSTVNGLVDISRELVNRYGIKNAAPETALRTITLDDVQQLVAEQEDRVRLAGGIYARKSAVTENSEQLSTVLQNEYGCTDVHTPEEVLNALKDLSPTQLIPLRPRIGA